MIRPDRVEEHRLSVTDRHRMDASPCSHGALRPRALADVAIGLSALL